MILLAAGPSSVLSTTPLLSFRPAREKSLESLNNLVGEWGKGNEYWINKLHLPLVKLTADPRPASPVAGLRAWLEQGEYFFAILANVQWIKILFFRAFRSFRDYRGPMLRLKHKTVCTYSGQ